MKNQVDRNTFEQMAEQHVFGKASVARSQDPSMFELLSWDVNPMDNRYSKKSPEVIRNFGDYNKFKYLLDHSVQGQMSETQDAFRLARIEEELDRWKAKEGLVNDKIKEYSNKENEDLVIEKKEVKPKNKIVVKPDAQTESVKANKNKQANTTVQKQVNDIVEQKTIVKQTRPKSAQAGNNQMTKSQVSASQKQRRQERVKKFREQTRWLPNSAFQTYFGKPAFENYGFRNTTPCWGGPVYGSYLKTHNINPQRGTNSPDFDQVYSSAQLASTQVNYRPSYIPRKCMDEYRQSQTAVGELNARLPLQTVQNKPVSKCGYLKKPNLMASRRFVSEENEPEE